eukprot:m.356006 g.356006  ORF g.356006 m.356006 type:complete len:1275 (+) comp17419_c0_seq1:783-4607(+)
MATDVMSGSHASPPASRNLYETLGVSRDAPVSDIKKAYHKQARKWHPDKNSSEEATVVFHRIRQAFQVLSHPVRKQVYDRGIWSNIEELLQNPIFDRPDFDITRLSMFDDGAAQRRARFHTDYSATQGSPSVPRNSQRSPPVSPLTTQRRKFFTGKENTGAAEEHFFPQHAQSQRERFPRQRRRRSQQTPSPTPTTATTGTDVPPPPTTPAPAPVPPRDTHKVLPVTLEELYFGFSKHLKYTRRVETAPGVFQDEVVALAIKGLPGYESGTAITFEGAGDHFLSDTDPRAVIIQLELQPHDIFRRVDNDLHITVMIPMVGALFGHTTDVPLLQGGIYHVPVEAVVPQQTHTVQGFGMPILCTTSCSMQKKKETQQQQQEQEFGDLVIEFQIAIPKHSYSKTWSTHSSTCPTSWKLVQLECTVCGETFLQRENAQGSCYHHPGQLILESSINLGPQAQQQARSSTSLRTVYNSNYGNRHWSCCGEDEDALGCQLHGAHSPTPDSVTKAKQTAAYNSLRQAVANNGDMYACGYQLLHCREYDLNPIAAIAMKQGNFMALALLLRAGAEVPHKDGMEAALRLAAQRDSRLIDQLQFVLENDKDATDILVRLPNAMRVVYSHICDHQHSQLAEILLARPDIGPTKCGLVAQPEQTSKLLLHCCVEGNATCLQLLLAGGADPNSIMSSPTVARTAPSTTSASSHTLNAKATNQSFAHISDQQQQQQPKQQPKHATQHPENPQPLPSTAAAFSSPSRQPILEQSATKQRRKRVGRSTLHGGVAFKHATPAVPTAQNSNPYASHMPTPSELPSPMPSPTRPSTPSSIITSSDRQTIQDDRVQERVAGAPSCATPSTSTPTPHPTATVMAEEESTPLVQNSKPQRSPLMTAIHLNQEQLIELLLLYGADVNQHAPIFRRNGAVVPNATSPLHAACLQGRPRLVAMLLQAGACIDWQSEHDGTTALHHACVKGNLVTLRLLIASGASTSIEDFSGLRPVDHAIRCANQKALAMLQPAIVQEALQSMEGLTIVKVLHEHVNSIGREILLSPSARASRQPLEHRMNEVDYLALVGSATLRSTLTVLESALRVLCTFSAGLDALERHSNQCTPSRSFSSSSAKANSSAHLQVTATDSSPSAATSPPTTLPATSTPQVSAQDSSDSDDDSVSSASSDVADMWRSLPSSPAAHSSTTLLHTYTPPDSPSAPGKSSSSTPLPSSPEGVVVAALRLYDLWCEKRIDGAVSAAANTGLKAVQSLVLAGISVKACLQQELSDREETPAALGF